MQVLFKGHLKDQNFLETLPAAEAEQFRERVRELPSYLTIELAETKRDKYRELTGMVRVDQEIHEKYGTLQDVPPSRGQTVFFRTRSAIWQGLKNIFTGGPIRLKPQLTQLRRDIMRQTLDIAERIQNNVNKVKDLTRPY